MIEKNKALQAQGNFILQFLVSDAASYKTKIKYPDGKLTTQVTYGLW